MSIPSANQSNRPKTAAPIAAHRLFPAIVALWFAALLGIGSLVIPPETLSALVGALGIPKLIHAAAPPLGFTARALLAVMMAGVGVIVGLVIGLRLASRHKVEPQRKTDPTRGRKIVPVRTYEYDPTDHLAGPAVEAAAAPQRGPLRASEAFADIEPLTDTAEATSQTFQADAGSPSDEHFAVLGAPAAEIFEPADESIHESGPDSGHEFGRDTFDDLIANAWEPEAVETVAPPAPFTTVAEQVEPAAFKSDAAVPVAPLAANPDARRTLVETPLENLGTVQLVERLALAMAAAAEARIASVADRDLQPRAVAPEPVAPASVAPASASATEEPLELETLAEPAPHHEHAPIMVASVEEPVAEPVHTDGEPQTARRSWSAPDFAEPIPEAAVASPARPSILDPIAHAWDDESADEDDAPTIAPPRFLSARAPATAQRYEDPAGALDDADADADGDDLYPSLLNIQPAAREAIRIPAPHSASGPAFGPTSGPAAQPAEPIVMFPNAAPRADAPFAPPPASTLQSRRSLPFQAPMGQSPGSNAGTPVTPPELPADPVDAEEADRAVRAALATLHRMSGVR